MTDTEKKDPFISLNEQVGSWADEPEETQEVAPTLKKSAWGNVAQVQAISIAEEQKKAQTEKKARKPAATGKAPAGDDKKKPARNEEIYRRPQAQDNDSGSYQRNNDYQNQSSTYQRRDYGDRDDRSSRPPREQNPLPDSPPYTAFVGNLDYNISEEILMEFFGELGVKQNGIRIVKDQTNDRSKGFGYVEFETRDGLSKALMSNNMEFRGRRLNVDVENKSQKRGDKKGYGTSSSFNPRGTTGGRGFSGSATGGRGFESSRPNASTERPRVNIAPRSEAPRSDDTKPRTGEDPFGGAYDATKFDEIQRKREERERDIEARKQQDFANASNRRQNEEKEKAERERNDREREQNRDTKRPERDDREKEIDSKSSWRSVPGSNNKPTAQGRGRGRGEEGRGRGSEEGGRGRGGRSALRDDGPQGRGGKTQDYYTGAGRGEKKAPSGTEHRSTRHQNQQKAQEQQKIVTNSFAALQVEGDDGDDSQNEDNQ